MDIQFQRIPANSRDQYKLEIFENLIEQYNTINYFHSFKSNSFQRVFPSKNQLIHIYNELN